MPRVLPLRTGWHPASERSDSYPEDLPSQWRLAYFANEYWGVLVPADRWSRLGTDEARDWVADTPSRFRFYLDLDGRDPAGTLSHVCASLGDRLGGLVGSGSALSAAAGLGVGRLLRIPPDRPEPDSLDGLGVAWVIPEALIGDLRGAGAWLEARVRGVEAQALAPSAGPGATRPQLALLEECRFEDLARWQTMLELMGFA